MAKEKEFDALNAAADLTLNGYFDINALIWFCWLSGYDSMTRYGESLGKATLKYSKDKKNLKHFIGMITEHFIPKVLKFQSSYIDIYRENLYLMLKMTSNILYPMVNKTNITADELWRLITVTYRTNQFRAEKGRNRLCWNSADFYHLSRQYRSDELARATATASMTAIVRSNPSSETEHTSKTSTTSHTSSTSKRRSIRDLKCWGCGVNGHFITQCPNRANKTKRRKGNSFVRHSPSRHTSYPQHNAPSYPQQIPMQYPHAAPSLYPPPHHQQIPMQHPVPPMHYSHHHPSVHTQMAPPQSAQPPTAHTQYPMNKGTPPNRPNTRQKLGAKYYVIRNGRKVLRDEFKNVRVCTYFDSPQGNTCSYTADFCRSPHVCSGCGSLDHGRRRCNKTVAALFATSQ